MVNNNHFPGLEGELVVRRADGSIKETQIINQSLGKGTITAKIEDKDGNFISETKLPFRSFVDNMALMLLNSFEGATNSMVDTAGATANCKEALCTAAAADDTQGIVVGLNDSNIGYLPAMAVTVDKADYALRRQSTEGTSVNKLTHGASTLSYTQGNGEFTLSRTFTNGTLATVIIKEIGIVGDDGSNNFLLSRDVDESVEFPFESTGNLTPLSLSIPVASVLTVTYNFEVADADGLLNNFLGVMASTMTQAAQNVSTVEVNVGSAGTVSVDFSNPNEAYKLWTAAAGLETAGFLVGDGTTSTSRTAYQLMNIEQALTHAEQVTGTITYPDVAGREIVSNDNDDWAVYKTRVQATRTFTNGTASAIDLEEGAIVLAGSAVAARVPIVRFKFPAKITLNAAEALEMTLRISMITNVKAK